MKIHLAYQKGGKLGADGTREAEDSDLQGSLSLSVHPSLSLCWYRNSSVVSITQSVSGNHVFCCGVWQRSLNTGQWSTGGFNYTFPWLGLGRELLLPVPLAVT